MISEFEQLREEPLHHYHYEFASKSLIEMLNQPHLVKYLANKTTRYLGGEPADRPLWEQRPNLDLAIERLQQLDFFGIVEFFKESLDLFCYSLGHSPIDEFERKNISENRFERKNIARNTLDYIAEINSVDIQFYHYATRLLQERFETIIAKLRPEERQGVYPLPQTLLYNFRFTPPGAGWHVGELHPVHGFIRWSGPNKISSLFFELKRGVDYIIRFKIVNVVATDILTSLSLKVNGTRVALKKSNEGEQEQYIFEGDITNFMIDLNHKRFTRIDFIVSRTAYPSETDKLNTDKRLMGICYNWLKIIPK